MLQYQRCHAQIAAAAAICVVSETVQSLQSASNGPLHRTNPFLHRPGHVRQRKAILVTKGTAARGADAAVDHASETQARPAMAHYVGVLMPLEAGGWKAVFPDVPQCQVEAASLDLTVFHAAAALADLNQRSDRPLAPPRDLAEIRLDDMWASACGVDWSRSVVAMIPVRG